MLEFRERPEGVVYLDTAGKSALPVVVEDAGVCALKAKVQRFIFIFPFRLTN